MPEEGLTVHVLTHAPFEGLGCIEPWLRARGAARSGTRLYAGERLPVGSSMALLVVMGGPMSVNDEATLPWISEEKRFVRDAIQDGVRVLGVCLGAQLVAAALGARVYPDQHREIGWYAVRAVAAPSGSFAFPTVVPAFHWHGETFDLPKGARHLAESDACRHQAFQVGETILGLQCHLEMTPAGVDALIRCCPDDLAAGPYVQPAAAIRGAPASHYRAANALMGAALGYLLKKPKEAPRP